MILLKKCEQLYGPCSDQVERLLLEYLQDYEFDRFWMNGPPTGRSRDRLIAHFMPLVQVIARKLKMRLPHSVDLDDLVSSGTLGLLAAVDRYVPQEGADFKRYAMIRIRGAMIDDLRNQDWAPRSQRRTQNQMNEAEQEIMQLSGRKATDQELADNLGLSVEELQKVRDNLIPVHVIHLEDMGRRDDSHRDILEFIRDPSSPDPAQIIQFRNEHERLFALVDKLPGRERIVLVLYYFDLFQSRDIARIFQLTEGRISQIHHAGLAKLKKKLVQLQQVF